MKAIIRWLFRQFGFEIARYRRTLSPVAIRRAFVFKTRNIQTVVDVGANVGDYGRELRRTGYDGNIVSFEPVEEVFRILKDRACEDMRWKCIQSAVGDRDGNVTINVSNRTASSSVLPMTTHHLAAAPDSAFCGTQKVAICTLDTLMRQGVIPIQSPVFLKMDVQGFEMNVMQGCQELLSHVAAIEIELSMSELYKGCTLYHEMITYLEARGFRLVSWEDVLYENESQFILQADAIFVRAIG